MLKKLFNQKLIKYLGVFYAIVTFVQALNSSYFKAKGYFTHYAWIDIWVYTPISDWTSVMIFMVFSSYITKRMHANNINLKLIFAIHFLLSLGLTIFLMTTVSIKTSLVSGNFDTIMKNITFSYYIPYLDICFLTYFSMLSIIYGHHYITKIKDSENQKTKLQTQLISTKMNILKAQLHPHFVFNTLNSISSLIVVDKKKSQTLIANFIDLFKGILQNKETHLTSLHNELTLLDKYIGIIIERFSDHLIIKKNIDKSLKDALIPNMLLQPLLENAIKHGYSYEKTELVINLTISKKDDNLIITIINNGTLLKKKYRELLKNGIGLKNTNDRLHNLFENNFDFIVKNNETKSGVETFIKIPYLTSKKIEPSYIQ